MKQLSPHRIFIAILWGATFAALVEHTKIGKHILEKINWLAVLVGVGTCWVIASPPDGDDHVDYARLEQHNALFFVLGWASMPIILQWAWLEKKRIGSIWNVHTSSGWHRAIKDGK